MATSATGRSDLTLNPEEVIALFRQTGDYLHDDIEGECRMIAGRTHLLRSLALAMLLAAGANTLRAESPRGKIVARIIPVDNHTHDSELILGQMQTRPGKPYDENTIQDDVRRLLNKGWFAPGGVRIATSVDNDGQVTVFVHVKELVNTIQEIHYVGAQHLSDDKLHELTQLRRGSPMNPTMNQLAAQAIRNKLIEGGRYYASVQLAEGTKISDQRVVFQIVEGPVVRVRRVDFVGNKVASSGRLNTQIVSKAALIPNVVTPLSQKFQPAMIDEDIKRLTHYYHNIGFLEARIAPEIVPQPSDPSKVDLVYHINEGLPYTVQQVKIEGNSLLPAEKLRSISDLKEGDTYNREVVQADIERIQTYYGMNGVRAAVQEAVFADPNQPGVVNIQYQVLESNREPDRVGRIEIVGNTTTGQRVILNQLGLYPGQILQYPMLEQARNNLLRLNIFNTDNPPTVEVIPQQFDSIYKDIRVTVQETQTGMIALSGNVNSNAGLSGSLVLNQRNFDILRVPRSLEDLVSGKAFRGGGQELRIEAMPGTQFQRYAVTFREPYLGDSRFGLTASGYYFTRGYAEYTEERLGGRFTLDYRFADSAIWRANTSVRVEDVTISNVPPWATAAIRDDIGSDFLLGLRAGVTRDTRDSYLLPTQGSQLDVGFEQVLGSNTFPIATAEFSKYYTMYQRRDGSGKHILAARSQVSATTQDAPVYERFFAGGFRSLRGFSFRGVGPFENYLNTGGTFSFLNSIEYQVPLLASDKLWFVTFVDHGAVENDVAIRDYRVSVGAGLRISVPALGPLPIALDFAYPIMKGPGDNQQIFSFYVGYFGGQ